MKNTFFALLLVAMVFGVGIALSRHQSRPIAMVQAKPKLAANLIKDTWSEPKELSAKRIRIGERALANAKRVAVTPEAKEAVKFLMDHHVFAAPGKDKRSHFLTKGDRGKDVVMVVLLSQDAKLSENWKGWLNEKGVGYEYFPTERGMFIKSSFDCSNLIQGFLLVHESVHALRDYQNPEFAKKDGQTPLGAAVAEVDAYSIQNENTRQYLGARYQQLLDREVELARQSYTNAHQEISGGNYGGLHVTEADIDKVFGKPKSVTERSLRDTHFWLHSYYTLVERCCPDEDLQTKLKIGFVGNEYEKAGIIKMPK